MDFKVIASSSAGNCYQLSCDDDPPLLIEAGISYPRIQRALDWKLSELAGCLISHHHGDHARSAQPLMDCGVDVYASAETHDAMGLRDRHRAKVLEPLQWTEIGPWAVLPFNAIHDAPGALGFLVMRHQQRLLFMTDSAYCAYRFDGLTHIAVECNFDPEIMKEKVAAGDLDQERYARTTKWHMSLPRFIQMLKANDLTHVREIHLLHLSDANSDERAFQEAVQRETGKPVFIAQKEIRNG